MTGSMSRRKGQSGELEAAALLTAITGRSVKRRVRQHDGVCDLVGLPGWSVEIKRYAKFSAAKVSGEWWPQALDQARATKTLPLLLYRVDRGHWTAVWCADLQTGHRPIRPGFEATLTGDPQTWWAIAGSKFTAGSHPE
jgi:hypothetical protein